MCRTNEWSARGRYNCHRLWAIYKEECERLGMVPLIRSIFYKFMSQHIFF